MITVEGSSYSIFNQRCNKTLFCRRKKITRVYFVDEKKILKISTIKGIDETNKNSIEWM